MTAPTSISDGGVADVPLVTASTPQAAPTDSAIQRAEATVRRLEQLAQLLRDDGYCVPPPDYEIPHDFKLSIIVPVYNEEATLSQVLARLSCLPLPKEIIVVDDFSTDGTRQLLKPLEPIPEIRIVYKPQNEGKGAALRTGFEHATGDVLVVQDADLEYDPRDIVPLLKPIVAGDADVAYGSRFLGDTPQDRSLVHRLGNQLLTQTSNWFTGLQLTDMETCYKAFRRDVICSLRIQQNRFGFEPEVTAKLARRAYRIEEVPITYRARGYADGKKIGIKDLFNAIYCIARYGIAD